MPLACENQEEKLIDITNDCHTLNRGAIDGHQLRSKSSFCINFKNTGRESWMKGGWAPNERRPRIRKYHAPQVSYWVCHWSIAVTFCDNVWERNAIQNFILPIALAIRSHVGCREMWLGTCRRGRDSVQDLSVCVNLQQRRPYLVSNLRYRKLLVQKNLKWKRLQVHSSWVPQKQKSTTNVSLSRGFRTQLT